MLRETYTMTARERRAHDRLHVPQWYRGNIRAGARKYWKRMASRNARRVCRRELREELVEEATPEPFDGTRFLLDAEYFFGGGWL